MDQQDKSAPRFTKGPWEVVDHPTYPSFRDVRGPSFKVSAVLQATDLTFSDFVQRDADLHLIAAAPDLYEALELFVAQWNACGPNSDFGRYFRNVRDAAVAALAKAGSQQ